MNTHETIGAYVATIRNAQTSRAYSKALERFEKIAPHDLAAIDEALLMPFMESLSGAITTKQLHLNAAISFFKYLIFTKQNNSISLDRAKLIKQSLIGRNPKRISDYSMTDAQAVVEYVKGLNVNTHDNRGRFRGCNVLENLRDRALILTLAETGLRKSEAVTLKLYDVDLHQGQAVVIGKGDKQAVVYFADCSQAAVTEYIEARRNKSLSSPLFMREGRGGLTSDTDHLDKTSVNNIVNRRAREVLGHGIAVHALRHWFCTNAWQQTHDLKIVQQLARHESITTTERYTHVSNDALREAHARIFNRRAS